MIVHYRNARSTRIRHYVQAALWCWMLRQHHHHRARREARIPVGYPRSYRVLRARRPRRGAAVRQRGYVSWPIGERCSNTHPNGWPVVATTTNGTRAIVAARGAEEIVIGGILNAASVARMAQRSGLSVTLLMAGTQGRFSMEDALGAGAIIDVLPDARPDDLGHACYRLFRESRADLRGALEVCAHYRRLVELGFADDIAWCIKRDALDTVPRFEKDRIVAG